ncbi:hypothetical protein ABK040_003473 [Willaertia magna]
MQTKSVIFKSHPEGMVKESDFEVTTVNVDDNLTENSLLVQLSYVSVDPYMRGRMNKEVPRGYFEPFKTGSPIYGGCIAKVLKSTHPEYKEGEYILGSFLWQFVQVINLNEKSKDAFQPYIKVQKDEKVPLSYYLGGVGMPGLTAYFGLLQVGELKEGNTVVVSAASGAVGSIVGQIAKIKNCRVVGITGGQKKVEVLKGLGFDEVIDYQNLGDKTLKDKLIEACPNGVDVYFDNVGGETLDTVTFLMNRYGRLVFCGSIANYNDSVKNPGPRLNFLYISNELKGQGFLVSSFSKQFPEARNEIIDWVKQGKLKVLETVEKGFENIPTAFIKLFTGDKLGKIVVDCE